VIVEDELTAELLVEFVAEALHALQDLGFLLAKVLLVVKPYALGSHYGKYRGRAFPGEWS